MGNAYPALFENGRVPMARGAHGPTELTKRPKKKLYGIYKRFAEDFMAVPVYSGLKTESEKFAGAITRTRLKQ